jgi:hypothetical protein
MIILSLLWQKHTRLLMDCVRGRSVTLHTLSPSSHCHLVESLQESGGSIAVGNLNDHLQILGIEELDYMVDTYLDRIRTFDQSLHLILLGYSRDKLKLDFLNQIATIEYLISLKRKYGYFILLVSEEYTRIPRVAVDWCSRNRMPIIHVAHAANLNRQYTVHSVLKSSYYVVSGKRSAESLLDLGLNENRIFYIPSTETSDNGSSGASDTDSATCLPELKKKVCKKACLMFATTFDAGLTFLRSKNVYVETLKTFLEACMTLKLGGYELSCVVKDRVSNDIHSTSSSDLIWAYREKGLDVNLVQGDIFSIIDWADIIVSPDSSVSVDAMMRNKIAVNLTGYENTYPEPTFLLKEVQHATPKTLPIVLARIISDPASRERLLNRECTALPNYVQAGKLTPSRMFENLLTMVYKSSSMSNGS